MNRISLTPPWKFATSHFINPKVPFHPVRDFEPISLIVKYPIIMCLFLWNPV